MWKVIKKTLKCILLYSTVIYFSFFVIGIDSITEAGNNVLMFGVIILISSFVACFIIFKDEDLSDYVPEKLK